MIKILAYPSYGEDMTTSISLTGVTILTQSSYRTRHSLPRELCQKPIEGIILRKDDKLENERLAEIKLKQRKRKKKESEVPDKIKVTKLYSVNKKEVTHRIRNMVNAMRGEKQLYFWTVTFPQGTTDDTAFICLNKWMTRLRKEKMLKTYLWVAERQENGTIHFHIAINHRMDVKKANRFMRACLFTCIDNNEIEFSRDAAMKYNGVDISKNRKTKRVTNFAKGKRANALTNYLTKYVTKNTGAFHHLAWHSSRDYSNLIIAVRLTENEYNKTKMECLLNMDKVLTSEWFTFIPWKQQPPPEIVNYLAKVNGIIIDILDNKN